MDRTTRHMNRRALMAGLVASGVSGGFAVSRVTAEQRSPFATPQASSETGATGEHPLAALLGLVPLSVAQEISTSGVPWTFVDLDRQFQSLGITSGLDGTVSDPTAVVSATVAFARAGDLIGYGSEEFLVTALGFHPLGLHQLLAIGDPPHLMYLCRAPFDRDSLTAAWQAAGYVQAEIDSDVPFWTIGPEGEMDLTNPLQSAMSRSINNLALVDDLLIAAPTLAMVEDLLTFHAEPGASLLDDPATGPLVASLPETIVSAIAMYPEVIGNARADLNPEWDQFDAFVGIREEVGLFPPMLGAIAAVNAGAIEAETPKGTPVPVADPDLGQVSWLFNMASDADAEVAAAVVEARWEVLRSRITDEPYAELMGLVEADSSGSVAELTFQQLHKPGDWYRMIYQLDLLPFQPDEA